MRAASCRCFVPTAVDTESWYNKSIHPRQRVLRHLQYERYILHEFLPFLRWKNQTPRLAVTGCSFGGYHAVNFSLKHPDVVTHCVSMSGAYDIHQFLDGYYDDDCYFNCPPDYRAEDERRLVSEPLAADEDRAGIGGLGYVSGSEREVVGDAERKGSSALAGCVGR